MFPEITRDEVFRLETRRLWLRWPMLADAADLADIAGRLDVAEMTLNVPHPYPKGVASRQIEAWREANAAGTRLALTITGRDAERIPYGVIEAEPCDGAAKLGILLAPERWGAGHATEAVQALIDALFLLTGVPRVAGWARVVNPAARRVLERCGFAYEGTELRAAPARGGMVPCDLFRLDRKAWGSLKQWRMPAMPAGKPRPPLPTTARPG